MLCYLFVRFALFVYCSGCAFDYICTTLVSYVCEVNVKIYGHAVSQRMWPLVFCIGVKPFPLVWAILRVDTSSNPEISHSASQDGRRLYSEKGISSENHLFPSVSQSSLRRDPLVWGFSRGIEWTQDTEESHGIFIRFKFDDAWL